MLLRMHSIIMMSFRKQNEIFRRRRDNFESQLKHAHLPFVHSKGGIYIWLHTPGL